MVANPIFSTPSDHLPDAEIILVNGGQSWLLFNPDEAVSTQRVLTGFNITVKELFSY